MPPDDPLRVLLTDDDAFVRDGLKLHLASQKLVVLEAEDVQSGRRQFARHEPPLVIVDLTLPDLLHQRPPQGGAGLKLVREFKQQAPQTGIVLLSAYDHFLDEFTTLLREGYRGLAYKLKGRRSRQLLTTLLPCFACWTARSRSIPKSAPRSLLTLRLNFNNN